MNRIIYLFLIALFSLTCCKEFLKNDDDSLITVFSSSDYCGLEKWGKDEDYPDAGTRVYYKGKEYQSRFYIHKGTVPNNVDHAPWELIGYCDAKPLPCNKVSPWKKNKTYSKVGVSVIYKDDLYESRWYISKERPTERSAWRYLGPCQ